MATQTPKTPQDTGDELEIENTPSPLDDKTHTEIGLLYRESTETLRFIKNHQWKTVGSTLLTYLGLIFIAVIVEADVHFTNKLMAITILLATSVIFTLSIYQFWMHNEVTKINRMEVHMSELFRNIRAIKSVIEGNIHRYTLLTFMFMVVILGAVVVNLALQRIATT